MNDLLATADAGKSSVLLLLDLSAPLDSVDRFVLRHLKHWVDISGAVIKWFSFYFQDRSFSAAIGKS